LIRPLQRLFACALLLAGACHPQPAVSRYLYVLTCDARLDKLDTVENQKVASYDLVKLPVNPPIPAATAGLDGCLAYQAEYDRPASAFFTVVSVQAMDKPDGKKDYREVEISIPAIHPVKNVAAGSDLDTPPHLSITGSEVKLSPGADWQPQTDLDLSAFTPSKEALGNQIIERSGPRALLRIFVANPGQVSLAVADTSAKTLVRLQELPTTTVSNAHLTPGGSAVLIEEVTGSTSAVKTGKLDLYDSSTGKAIGQLTSASVREQYFLAISPSGRAVYHSAEAYSFVDLKRTFTADEVTRPNNDSYPALFFADK
jgi:hypothetical protein